MERIDWEHFERVDLRIGTVVKAEPFPEALRPAIKMTIDFGPLGLKKTSAQITDFYTPESLLGRQVVAVVNFPPKQIGPVLSEVLVLGGLTADGVVLLNSDKQIPNGSQIA
jgi:tRNA-binding protein